jgi:hypothetical protein
LSSPSVPVKRLAFVLLLGSYDEKTLTILKDIRTSVACRFGHKNVYSFILDDVEVFGSSDLLIFAERYKKRNYDIRVFRQADGKPEEDYPIVLRAGQSIEDAVNDLLEREYNVRDASKQSVIDKFYTLVGFSISIIVVRNKSLTKGGEVAELVYCILKDYGSKICVFKREGVELSSMLIEFLNIGRVVMRTYRNEKTVSREVLSYVWAKLKEARAV